MDARLACSLIRCRNPVQRLARERRLGCDVDVAEFALSVRQARSFNYPAIVIEPDVTVGLEYSAEIGQVRPRVPAAKPARRQNNVIDYPVQKRSRVHVATAQAGAAAAPEITLQGIKAQR